MAKEPEKAEVTPIPKDLDPDATFALEVQHEGEPRLITTSLRALAASLTPFVVPGGGGGAGQPQNPPAPPLAPAEVVPVLLTADDVATLILDRVAERVAADLKLRLKLKDGKKLLATTGYVLRDLEVVVEHG